MMLHFIRRPMRGVRVVLAAALLASFVVAAPMQATAVTNFALDKPSSALQVDFGASAEATFAATWDALETEDTTLTVESDQPSWLTASPQSVDVTGTTSQEITLAVDASTLGIGTHEATVTVSLEGTTITHPVVVTVPDPDVAEPDDVFPGIEASTAPQPIQGWVDPVNDKRDIYSFRLTEGQFLHVSVGRTDPQAATAAAAALFGPDSTNVDSTSTAIAYGPVSSTATFTADVTAGAGGGTYHLLVAADAGTSAYRLDWSIGNPTFALAADSTSFEVVKGSAAPPSTLRIDWGEVGRYPVTFTTHSDRSWLEVAPGSAKATGNSSAEVTLTAQTASLDYGLHEATVTVGILGAEPRTHRVRVNVLDQPTLSPWASNARVKYGTLVTFKGTLTGGSSAPRDGRSVVLQRSYNGSTWTTAAVAPVSSTGWYSAAVRVYQNTRFRWYFPGDSTFAPATSAQKIVKSYAYVTRPNVPSRVRPKRNYTFYGDLKPQHAAGSAAVKVQFQYYYRGKWRSDVTMAVRVHNPDAYRSRYRYADRYVVGVPKRWRVRAIHGDSSHLTTYSSWRYYSVY